MIETQLQRVFDLLYLIADDYSDKRTLARQARMILSKLVPDPKRYPRTGTNEVGQPPLINPLGLSTIDCEKDSHCGCWESGTSDCCSCRMKKWKCSAKLDKGPSQAHAQ